MTRKPGQDTSTQRKLQMESQEPTVSLPESLSHALTFLLSPIYLEGLPSAIHPFVGLRPSLSLLPLSPQLLFSPCFFYWLDPNTSPILQSPPHP